MSSRTRWIVVLAALLSAVAWLVLRDRLTHQQGVPNPAAEAPATPAELAEPMLVVRDAGIGTERVALEPAEKNPTGRRKRHVDAQRPNEGLLRVGVMARETRTPLIGIELLLVGFDNNSATRIRQSRGRPHQALETDANGRVEFLIPENVPYQLWVNTEAQRASSDQVEIPAMRAGEERTIEVELSTFLDERTYLRVVDGETGLPLVDAIVTLQGLRDLRLSTDDGGRTEFATATWRDDVVRVEREGYPAVLQRPGDCKDPSSPCEIQLLRAATLDARVTDSTGKSLAGVQVRVSDDGGWLGEVFTRSAKTDADGRCALEGLPSRRRLELELRQEELSLPSIARPFVRREHEALVLEPGERREWTGTVWDGVALEGSIVDESGVPQPQFEVCLLPEELSYRSVEHLQEEFDSGQAFLAVSDQGGHFIFERVPPGPWWLRPGPNDDVPPAEAAAGGSVTVRIVRGESPPPVTLTICRGLYIRGRVVRPDGSSHKPDGTMTCLVGAQSSEFWAHTYANKEGEFTLGPLLRGEYLLSASGGADFARSEPLAAQAGTDDVVLRLRDAGSLVIRVVDSRGRGVSGANVVLLSSGSDSSSDCSTTTGKHGECRFGTLPAGSYHVIASTEAGSCAWIRELLIESGKEAVEQEMRLEPGARLRLRTQGFPPGELECRLARDGLKLASFSFLSRSTQQLVVPPGRIEVSFVQSKKDDPRPPEPRIVELAPGEERELVFDLEAAPR